jgi:four helix bundle protein
MLKNFRTYQLALEFHKTCEAIKTRPHIKDQLSRATLSIVLNLAEGSAKPTYKDRQRFYAIAFGSFRESQAILQIMDQKEIFKTSDHLGACLYKLSHHKPAP